MAQIFVSYSHKDVDLIKPYVNLLQIRGYTIFWDPNLREGELWRQRLYEEHKASQCVLAFWTTASLTSYWVFDECQAALKDNKLLPVILDRRTEIPPGFSGIQYLDLSPTHEDHEDKSFQLIEALNNRITYISSSNNDESHHSDKSSSISFNIVVRSDLKNNSFVENLRKHGNDLVK